MSVRFFRRLKLFPGVSLNFSKRGMSASVGAKGGHVTMGTSGTTVSAGLPGTGLSIREAIHRIPPDCDCFMCQGESSLSERFTDREGCAHKFITYTVIGFGILFLIAWSIAHG